MTVALVLPTIGPYKIADKTAERRQFKRNPYSWKVDKEVNQLPYIDRIDTQIVSDLEVIQRMIMSGAVDFVGYGTDLRNYPIYRSYEEGGYRTLLWESGMGSEVILMVNQTHEDWALRELFQDRRVRQAISLAIDREEINEVVYFGQGMPRQDTVLDTSHYYEPEFETTFIEYDPEQAGELLDEAGLDQYDSESFRLRPDGERFMFTIEHYDYETPKAPVVGLIIQHLQEVGVDARSRFISGELMGERAPANMLDANVWHGDKATDILFPTNAQFFVPMPPGWERTIWPLWGTWFNTDSAEGERPPEHIKKLYGWWDDMLGEPDEERRIELGKQINQAQAENLWTIGTIGQAPQPLVVSEDLRNFPEEGFWVWDTIFTDSHFPSTDWLDR